jgi:hypothetical protein
MADTETRQWRVTMADKTTRTVEAHGFRVEGGALVLAAARMRCGLRARNLANDRSSRHRRD